MPITHIQSGQAEMSFMLGFTGNNRQALKFMKLLTQKFLNLDMHAFVGRTSIGDVYVNFNTDKWTEDHPPNHEREQLIRQSHVFIYVVDMEYNYCENFEYFFEKLLGKEDIFQDYLNQIILVFTYESESFEYLEIVDRWKELLDKLNIPPNIFMWKRSEKLQLADEMNIWETCINLHFNSTNKIILYRACEFSRYGIGWGDSNPNPMTKCPMRRSNFTFDTVFYNILQLLSQNYYNEKSLDTNFEPQYLIKSKQLSYSSSFAIKLAVIGMTKLPYNNIPHQKVVVKREVTFVNYCFAVRLRSYLSNLSLPKTITRHELKNTVETIIKNFTRIYDLDELKIIREILAVLEIEYEDRSQISRTELLIDYCSKISGNNYKIETILEIMAKEELFKKYEIISVLGHGGEGVVFKAFDLSIDELVAIKINFEQEYDLERAYSKIEFLKRPIEGKIGCLDCGLVEFGGNRSKYLYSVMELGEKTLREIISSFYQKTQTSTTTINRKHQLIEKIEIFSKILTSIQSVHNQNIVHRDLDPKNIVKFKNRFKIIDFDQSRIAEIGRSITINIGKYCYMAPEISENSYEYNDSLINESKLKQNNNVISTSCDIFSLGCILFELITNCPLRLNRKVMNNTFNNKNDSYFDLNGFYFHACVLTNEGEKKLHFGIQKELETQLDCDEQAKKLLSESIITMIQRDSDKRLNAFTYKLIMDNLIKYLHGEIADCSQGITSFIPKFDYSEKKENISSLITKYELTKKNQLLMKDIEQLPSGTLDLPSLIDNLEIRVASLKEEILQVNLEQLEINRQNDALILSNLEQREETEQLKKELAQLNISMEEY